MLPEPFVLLFLLTELLHNFPIYLAILLYSVTYWEATCFRSSGIGMIQQFGIRREENNLNKNSPLISTLLHEGMPLPFYQLNVNSCNGKWKIGQGKIKHEVELSSLGSHKSKVLRESDQTGTKDIHLLYNWPRAVPGLMMKAELTHSSADAISTGSVWRGGGMWQHQFFILLSKLS